eukprot:scaffold26695_cov71-Cyclotella_meneghiniana.AAC.8
MIASPSRNRSSNEDSSTVQVIDANSLLGSHLLEGDWDDALEHLATPEGSLDVVNSNNPLGLFNPGGSKAYASIPKDKTTALFASLFVRAPYDVIANIYQIAPTQCEPNDLFYLLSIIPSEEETRLVSNPRQRIPYRSRAWLIEEYNQILHLLLQHNYSSKSPLFLTKCPSWILPFPLTPLSMGAYNPDVTDNTLSILCALEPKAISTECKLFGVETLPYIVAAASPIPPIPSADASVLITNKYEEAKERRWRKVKALIIEHDWYSGSSSQVTMHNPVLREPTMDEIYCACEEAMKRNEWEIIREFLKRQDETSLPLVQAQYEDTKIQGGDGMDVDIKVSPVATAQPVNNQMLQYASSSHTSLDCFRVGLTKHDEKHQTKLQKQQKAREKHDWARKNMGLAMYPVDAMKDVGKAMIPRSLLRRMGSKDDEDEHVIVPSMS